MDTNEYPDLSPANTEHKAGPRRCRQPRVAPANLTQRGGSVLTIDDGRKNFDGIVFGERAPAKWMAGSDNFRRTEKQQEDRSAETADADTFVQMAIAYRGNEGVFAYTEHYAFDPKNKGVGITAKGADVPLVSLEFNEIGSIWKSFQTKKR